MDSKQHIKPSILMLPWLAYGHLSPFFELAKKLSQNNFQIYLCSTQINLQSISENLDDETLSSSSIELIEIQLPTTLFPGLHPHNLTTKNLPPHLGFTLGAAFEAAKPEFCKILDTLKPSLVIYDMFQPWAAEAASQLHIPAVFFLIFSAIGYSFLMHTITNPSLKFPFFLESEFFEAESKKLSQFMDLNPGGSKIKDTILKVVDLSSKFILIKSCTEIESKYLDYFSDLTKKETVPVGLLVPDPTYTDKHNIDDTKILDWLSRKEACSVVYASFGSEYFLSKEEIDEIANGLLLSEVSFIWVVRLIPEEKLLIEEMLPQGFAEEIEVNNKGMIIKGWAPQAKILRHGSIGGFVSHCGWSSTVEAMVLGIPIIAIPMANEQPYIAKSVVDLGAGMEVPREKMDQKLRREELARVIKKVVVEEDGEQIRRKGKGLSERLKNRGDAEINVVVEKLLQLINS